MERSCSLLERLSSSTLSRYETVTTQGAQLESLKANLQEMLNVREGSVAALPDYGMPDFNDLVFEFPDAIYQLQVAIRRFLLKYEPRLKEVSVSYLPDRSQPLQLRYRIGVTIHSTESAMESYMFDTVITGSGQAFIAG